MNCRVKTIVWIAVFLFHLPTCAVVVADSSHREVVTAGGTLIVYAPIEDGLIVAADSRKDMTMMGVHCDGEEKIVPLKRHPRAVVAVAGDDATYVTNDPAFRKNPCSYISSHQPYVSFTTLALKFLDDLPGEIDQKSFEKLDKPVMKAVQLLHNKIPNSLPLDPDGGIVTITYGYYDAKANLSIRGTVRVCMDPSHTGGYIVCERNWDQIGQTHLGVFLMSGSVSCFTAAHNPEGRKLLGPAYFTNLDRVRTPNRRVATITHRDGLSASVDAIDAAAKYSSLNPTLDCGIGTPVRAYLLDGPHPKPFKLQ